MRLLLVALTTILLFSTASALADEWYSDKDLMNNVCDLPQSAFLIRQPLTYGPADRGKVFFKGGDRVNLMEKEEGYTDKTDGCYFTLKDPAASGTIPANTYLNFIPDKWKCPSSGSTTTKDLFIATITTSAETSITVKLNGPVIQSITCRKSSSFGDVSPLTVGDFRRELGWARSGILQLDKDPVKTAVKGVSPVAPNVGQVDERMATLPETGRAGKEGEAAPAANADDDTKRPHVEAGKGI